MPSEARPQAGSPAALAEIERRLAALERAIAGRQPSTTPEWAEPRWYEPTVQLALGKLLRLGDLAFDVGANIGVIAAMMGAAVGPYGRVVAFEASPRTIGQLHVNLNNSNAFNVSVLHAAVADRSGGLLPIFYGADTPADSIFTSGERQPDDYVPSIALDDYVERLGVAPRVVKIDVEGAELLALQGFRRTLARHHPALIIETLSTDLALDELLQSVGYDLCVDVASLARFEKRGITDLYLRNLLYLHESEDRGALFRSERRAEVARFRASDLTEQAGELQLDLGTLPPGLYVLRLDYSPAVAAIEDNAELRLGSPRRLHAMYIAPLWHLAVGYSAIPFELPREMPASVSFRRIAAETVRGVLPAVRLERLEEDTNARRPVEKRPARRGAVEAGGAQGKAGR